MSSWLRFVIEQLARICQTKDEFLIDESIAGEVGKDNVLAMADDIGAVAQQQNTLTVAHDENASA